MEEIGGDIPKEYKNFNNQVFNKTVFEKLPDWFKWNHTIKLIPNVILSQTSFGHTSISSLTIPMVLMEPKSPWKDLSIDTSHVLKWSVMAKILGRSTGNYHGTIY